MSWLIDLALRRISRAGLPRFWAGGSWLWLVAAGTAFLLLRARHRETTVVTTRQLHPGERYLVTLK